jgi:hypothetical protein
VRLLAFDYRHNPHSLLHIKYLALLACVVADNTA